MNSIKIYLVIVFMSSCFIACSDMDDSYAELIKDGGTTYVGKVDSVQVASGKKRLKLSWLLSADPSLKKVKVFWNNKTDSLEIPVENPGNSQRMEVLIDDLDEGKHTFEIITYDSRGNTSIKVELLGEAFGDLYASTIVNANRPVQELNLIPNEAHVLWGNLSGSLQTGFIGSEVTYVDLADITHKKVVSIAETLTVIPNVKPGSKLEYRAMYLPVALAIDTFYSAFESKEVPLYVELDKTKFAKVVLATDNTTTYQNNPIYQMEKLWDNTTSGFYYTGVNSGIPTWFTFDIGKVAQLKKLLYQQRNTASVLWGGQNARKFEIWGRADAPTDGSWAGWTKLMDVDSPGRPSGQTTNTPEDLVAAAAGDEYIFTTPTLSVRYIRIKVIQTWANSAPNVHMGELTFWE